MKATSAFVLGWCGLLAGRVSAQEAVGPPSPIDPAPDVVALDTFVVSTERDSGYRAANSISATRTNTPIRDVPLNLQVFAPELIADLAVQNQLDLYAYSAALVDGGRDLFSTNAIQPSEQVVFRGFGHGWSLRDGVREYDPVDTQNLSRIEVVKGPAAALYGITLPGGVVNSVTKAAALDRAFAQWRVTLDQHGGHRATVDANTSVAGAAGKLGVRVNGVHGRSADERAHSRGRFDLAAAALAWQPAPATLAEVFLERGSRARPNGLGWFTRPEFPDASGFTSLNRAEIPLQVVHPEIPWTWNWANGQNHRALETHRYLGTLTQRIGSALEVRAYWQSSDRRNQDATSWGAFGDPGAISWMRQFGWNTGWVSADDTAGERIQSAYAPGDWSNRMHAYGATGVYKVEFGGTRHTFAFGQSIWNERATGRGHFADEPAYVAHPVQAEIALPVPAGPPPGGVDRLGMDQDNANTITFLNWQASWWEDRLKTNAGLSRTRYRMIEHPTYFFPETKEFGQSHDSPLAGAVLALTPELALFGVYATSLFPDPMRDSRLRHFGPIVGRSVEGGLKFDLANGRLSGTVSHYRITFAGGSQYDPGAPNATPGVMGDLVEGGEQVSQGVELDVVLQPVRAWQIVVSYANNRHRITKSAVPYTIGQSSLEHVDDRFAVVTKYTVADGRLKGLFLGLGASGGSRALKDYVEWPRASGHFVARYEPGRTTVDLFAGRSWPVGDRAVLLQFNVRNVTRAPHRLGWMATGSPDVLATERYAVPTRAAGSLTLGVDW